MLCIWLKEALEGKKIESIKKSKNQELGKSKNQSRQIKEKGRERESHTDFRRNKYIR